jgi:flagellar M-ring protein FliF
MSVTDRLSENVVTIVQGLFGVLIVALVMLLGVRPVLRQLREPEQIGSDDTAAPALTAAESDEGQETGTGKNAVAATAQASKGTGATAALPDFTTEDMVPVKKEGIRGVMNQKYIDKVQTIADEKPEEVLRVLRSWLVAEADA